MAREFRDATPQSLLKAMLNNGMKVIEIRDAAGRIEAVYEASLHIDIGEPCLRTRLKYLDGAAGSSRKVIAMEEDVVAWPGYEVLEIGAGNDFDLVP